MRTTLSLLGLLFLGGLSLSSCSQTSHERQAATQAAADSLHLLGSEWTEGTGQISLHFTSAEELHFTYAPSGAPMKLQEDLDYRIQGDSIFIEDYSKISPMGSVTILKGFKGRLSSREIHADFTSVDPQPNPNGGHPSFADIQLTDVVFTRK